MDKVADQQVAQISPKSRARGNLIGARGALDPTSDPSSYGKIVSRKKRDAPPELSSDLQAFYESVAMSLRENTRRAYQTDLRAYAAYCLEAGAEMFDERADSLKGWLGYMANPAVGVPMAISTRKRRAACIKSCYVAKKIDLPRSVLKELGRATRGNANIVGNTFIPTRKKKGLSVDQIEQGIAAIGHSGTTEEDIRDRAMLALSFCGAFRREEVATLRGWQLAVTSEGVVVSMQQHKGSRGDPLMGGEIKVSVYSERLAIGDVIQDWLDRRRPGPNDFVFTKYKLRAVRGADGKPLRSKGSNGKRGRVSGMELVRTDEPVTGYMIWAIVKWVAKELGLDETLYGGHSMRRGFITGALKAGAPAADVMTTVRIKDTTTLMGYFEGSERFEDHPAKRFM